MMPKANLAEPDSPAAESPTVSRPKCGLVMPISKSVHHSAEHWQDVQTLLHRTISEAGFEPENVWEGDFSDRISKRIVGNLFSHEIVVVDVSSANPNVMLELGLRLASKRPTIVVCDDLAVLPFDIKDLNALDYPPDLNILAMESFFAKLIKVLKVKHDLYLAGNYESFLDDVIVEVVRPETREVSLDSAVLERLDEINSRVSRMEGRQRDSALSINRLDGHDGLRVSYTVPSKNLTAFLRKVIDESIYFKSHVEDSYAYVALSGPRLSSRNVEAITALVVELGGVPGVPGQYLEHLK